MENSLVYIIKTSGIHEEEEDGKNNYTSSSYTKSKFTALYEVISNEYFSDTEIYTSNFPEYCK